MRKQVVPSTTKNNWNSLRSRIDSALNEKKEKSKTKVTKATSVTQNALSGAEMFKHNQKRLANGEFEQARRAGLERYYEERRRRKESYAKTLKYLESNGLRSWAVLIPKDLHKAFKAKCKKDGMKMCETVCELLLEFITKPDSNAQ